MRTANKNSKLLITLFTGVLMGALDISIVGPAIPEIAKNLMVEEKSLGWIFSIYVLFNLVGISLFAKLSDLFGRRLIYIISVLIFATGSMVVALSDNYTVLLIGRAVQGFGSSGIFPVASAIVGDVFPAEKRGRVLGLLGAVFGIAFLIGPVLAGVILMFLSWHYLFLINLPIAVAIIVGSIKYLPGKVEREPEPFDWKGIILLGFSLGIFAYGINQIEAAKLLESLLSFSVFPFLLLALIFLIVFIYVERRVKSPVVKPVLFHSLQIRLVVVVAAGTGLLEATFVFIPDFAVRAFQVTSSQASFMLLPVVLATAIGSPLFGRMIDKSGSRLVILMGLVFVFLGFLVLFSSEISVYAFYIAGTFIGLGLSILAGSALRYIMLNEVGFSDRASSQGLITIFKSAGQMFGAVFIGVVVASEQGVGGYYQLFLYMAVIVFMLGILSLGLKNKVQEFSTTS